MAPADIRQRPGLVFAAAVLLQVVLISTQVTTRTGTPLLQVAVFGAFAEVQRLASGMLEGVREFWNAYVALQEVRRENAALRQALDTTQIRLQEERALAQRTEALRQLLELRERAGLVTTGAEVIAAGPTPEFHTVSIGKGSADGLVRDMAVISPSGVVGRVTLTSPRAAQVQLITDGNAAAGALLERTRVQGVIVGIGDGMLRMQYVPSAADVRVGDLVVTAGIDGIYPKGFVIGTVTGVTRATGVYQDIGVRPAVNFATLEEVLVVRGRAAETAAPATGGGAMRP